MAEDIKQEMNETPGCIPTKWTRTTVADGDWLQENTIKPLSSRDNFLADKLSAASVDLDALSAAIDTVSSISDTKDTFLSGSIDYVSATLDSFSAKVETSAKSLYDSISAESDARRRGDEDLQGKINVLEAANDVIMVYGTHEEFVAGSASLHLTDKDVIKVLFDDTVSSNQVYYEYTLSTNSWDKIGELDPYYSKAEIESFSANLSSTIANTYLSANGTDISAGKNLDVVIQSNNPRVAFKTKDEVSFSNLTSTNTISTNFSGKTLSGETLYTSIDGLIESATNGGAMTGVKNVSGIKLTHIANESDREQNPDDGEFAFSTSADQLTFYVSGGAAQWLKPATGQSPYGICLTGLSIEDYLYGKSLNITADHAYTAGTTLDDFTATTPNIEYVGKIQELHLSAGKGIDFVSGSDGKLTISSEGTTYTTGQYINISNDNKISVTGTLINSAQSGQSAYNWITGQSATLSAGPGIIFSSAAQNTLGISVNYTTTDGYVTELNGVPLSAGANYTQGRCIEIDSDNSIKLSANVSATSYYTYEGATTDFSACTISSNGIEFIRGGSNTNYPYYRNALEGTAINIRYDNKNGGIENVDFKSSTIVYSQTARAPGITFSVTGNWSNIISASKLKAGSGIEIIHTTNDNEIYLTANKYTYQTTATQEGSLVVIPHEETACSSLELRATYPENPTDVAKNVIVLYNNTNVGSLIPTPPSYSYGEHNNYYLAAQPSGPKSQERHWEPVSSITANCISGNGTITAIVSASTIGSQQGVLYLV